MRYFITLSYDGTNYHGWQIQPNGVSVQETLQQSLSTLLRQEIEVVGAGRTDAGVHARMMLAHFNFDETLDCPQLTYRLNKILPQKQPVCCRQQQKRLVRQLHRYSKLSTSYDLIYRLESLPRQFVTLQY